MSQHGRKYWIKLYIELLNDDKVAPLNDSAYRRFIECLLLAGELDEGGYLPPIGRMAWKLRLPESALQTDLSHLAQNGLLELKQHSDGSERWFVTKFDERQSPSPGAERTREYRKRKKETETETETYRTVTEVTKRHTNVTPPNGSLSPVVEPSLTTQAHPAVKAMYQVTTYWPGEVTHPIIIEKIGDTPDVKALGRAYQLWMTNGNNPKNFDGICDWYHHIKADPNWTPRARFNGNGSTDATAERESLWQRAIRAIESGRVEDALLRQAIQAVGGSSSIKQANEYTTRQLKERLFHEYHRNAATA